MEPYPTTNRPEILNYAERRLAADDIIQSNLLEIDRKYGPNGPTPLAYHNKEHSLDVVEAFSELGALALKNGRITERQLITGKVIASGHDLAHDKGSPFDEIESAQLVAEAMYISGDFDMSDIEEGKMMLIGTTTFIDEKGIMRQSASPSHYPSMLLADADLASLGKPSTTYWDRAMRIYKEMSGNMAPTDEQLAKFALEQEKFLRSHQFYTKEARQLYPNSAENILYTAEMAHLHVVRAVGHSAIMGV